MSVMDINKVLSLLPHRYPFLLIDRVLEFEKDNRLLAIKNVTYNEPFFNGHFQLKEGERTVTDPIFPLIDTALTRLSCDRHVG